MFVCIVMDYYKLGKFCHVHRRVEYDGDENEKVQMKENDLLIKSIYYMAPVVCMLWFAAE